MYKCWDSVEGERIGHPSPRPCLGRPLPAVSDFCIQIQKKKQTNKKKLYWNLWRMARSWIPIEIKYNCSVNCVLFTLYSCIPTNMVYCIIDTVVSKTWTTIFMKCDSTDILHFAKKKQKKNLFTERYSEILSNKLLTWCKIFSLPFCLMVIFGFFYRTWSGIRREKASRLCFQMQVCVFMEQKVVFVLLRICNSDKRPDDKE